MVSKSNRRSLRVLDRVFNSQFMISTEIGSYLPLQSFTSNKSTRSSGNGYLPLAALSCIHICLSEARTSNQIRQWFDWEYHLLRRLNYLFALAPEGGKISPQIYQANNTGASSDVLQHIFHTNV